MHPEVELAGPLFTPGFVANHEIASQSAEIGVILLMFGVGLHFHLKDLLAVRNVVDDYLTAQGVNDCNLLRTAGSPSAGEMWTFQASGNGCPATFTLSIERSFAPSTGPGNIHPIFTRIEISYPYSFYFSSVFNNAGLVGAKQIGTDAIEPNMD